MEEIEQDLYCDGVIEELSKYGFDIDNSDIHWRISHCQGDGFSFDFNNFNEDSLLTFLKETKSDNLDRFKTIVNQKNTIPFDLYYYTYKNSFATHYCHSKTRGITYDVQMEDNLEKHVEYNYICLFDDIKNEIESFYLDYCDQQEDLLYKIIDGENEENEEDENIE